MDPVFDSNKFTEDYEGQSTANTSTTPNSEVSPPESPKTGNARLGKGDGRANSRHLASTLSLEEQVMIPTMRFLHIVLTT